MFVLRKQGISGEAAVSTIFISYRRSDSEGEAGRLADELNRRFGEHAVFMDVDTIQPGRDFRKAIDDSIRSCDVLLALVGPDWLGAADAAGHPRLFNESDYVRLEIASALKRDIAVIPVLVRGARMPTASVLPPDLADFAYRNCVELTHARWRSDVQFLGDALVPLTEGCTERPYEPIALTVTPAAVALGSDSAVGVASGSVAIDPAILQKVSTELARYIGPIAHMLVKRSARGCTALSELITLTAQEIEVPSDRLVFVTFGEKLNRTSSIR